MRTGLPTVRDCEDFPAAVRVGHLDLRIAKWPQAAARSAARLGEFAPLEQEIRIDESLSLQNAAECLMHELLHACWRMWNIAEEDGEERTVNSLGYALCALWRDNPQVLAWIGRHCGARLP